MSSSSTAPLDEEKLHALSLEEQTFLGLTIFRWPLDWKAAMASEWHFDLRPNAIGFGPEFADPKQGFVAHGWDFASSFRSDEVADVDAFLDALEGRATPFWLPGPLTKFKIAGADTDSSFLIDKQSADSDYQLLPGSYIWLTKWGEDPQAARVSSVVGLPGAERVFLSSDMDTAVDETWECNPLFLVRLSDDAEQVDIGAELYTRRQFKVFETTEEYALLPSLPPPSRPVYLYKFWVDLPTGQVAWRLTSHSEDVFVQDPIFQSSSSSSSKTDTSSSSSYSSASSQSSSSSSTAASFTSSSSSLSSSSRSSSSRLSYSSEGSYTSSSQSQSSSSSSSSKSSSSYSSPSSYSSHSSESSGHVFQRTTHWLASRVQHDQLSRSARNGGTLRVSGDYDEVEPLRLLCPVRLAVPLMLEVFRTNRAGDEPQSVFRGAATGKPSLAGRMITAQFSEWGDAMDGVIPGFFIQRNCNYRVYDPDTCRKSKVGLSHSVTLVSATARNLIVQGHSLRGVAQHWFAYGWLEVGSGLNRRVLYVTDSSVSADDLMTLVVTVPPGIDLPASGTLLPGCDGQAGTCRAKFDNYENFGGHFTPEANLSIKGINTGNVDAAKK